ncbi:MAG: class I SAM-dependent methyltransferase [Sulfuricella sp.]
MRYFAKKVVLPFLRDNRYSNICEIGALVGGNTDQLTQQGSIKITVIDPCISTDLCEKFKSHPQITMCKGLSLDFLPRFTQPFDCILIDGDHNWYTVYHELKVIEEKALLADGGAILLHDVSWPYARRDMYYQPETIPVEYRHPHAKQGIKYGKSTLSPDSGFNPDVYNATHEGGPRNGVLTAIEDFLKEHGQDYYFFTIEKEYGLCFLIRKNAKKSIAMKYFFKSKYLNLKENAKRALNYRHWGSKYDQWS